MVVKIFTGIIEELGVVKNIVKGANSCKINIQCQEVLSDVKLGDSIAINGVCLTVVEFSKNHFIADVMAETLEKTILKELKSGSQINLERALRLSDRLGGHLVQGHVDGVGTILEKENLDISIIFRIQAPEHVLKYIIPKGSIAIDGISLTVVDVFAESFSVSVIPHTATITTLGQKDTGDKVNLETDIIGRYIERLILNNKGEIKDQSKIDLNFLSEHGFI
ncbi:Riboflavin synthase eubacterial/eukaryotic [Candidatus Syntrophocurvum alkaliphilum]|uniref:Riboflavin synthase n=1 Tax=Candidatus Syntrophocurvum alkaliphilum TaxID=2293317 RepID=A0A6I6DEN8_9FIRM|nr:Riboflavin synthase eubacterial/eukaryotic [Candidatus Syntrophocurvum alkaliphilum]